MSELDMKTVKDDFVDMHVERQIAQYAPLMKLVDDAGRRFDGLLRDMQARAWNSGKDAGIAWAQGKADKPLSNPYEIEEA